MRFERPSRRQHKKPYAHIYLHTLLHTPYLHVYEDGCLYINHYPCHFHSISSFPFPYFPSLTPTPTPLFLIHPKRASCVMHVSRICTCRDYFIQEVDHRQSAARVSCDWLDRCVDWTACFSSFKGKTGAGWTSRYRLCGRSIGLTMYIEEQEWEREGKED